MTRDTDERGKLADKIDNADAVLVRDCPMVTKFDHENIDTMLSGEEQNLIIAALRARAPSEGVRHKIEYGGPPCPTCGFRIVSKPRRAPFMIEDDAPADTEDQGPDTLGERP